MCSSILREKSVGTTELTLFRAIVKLYFTICFEVSITIFSFERTLQGTREIDQGHAQGHQGEGHFQGQDQNQNPNRGLLSGALTHDLLLDPLRLEVHLLVKTK